jgi:Protein of Unknown function (DUF2784)
MVYAWLADLLLIVHGLFIAWAVLGALAVAWRPWLAWLHLPACAWAVGVMASGAICPLTPLEWSLRQRAGQAGHGGGFIEHYLTAAIYPEGLTRELQWLLGGSLLVFNLACYGALWLRRRRRRSR